MDFEKIAILGGGLLGGSVALAIRERFPDCSVSVWSRREDAAAVARQRGIADSGTDMAASLDGASLVILGTPVGVMPALAAQALTSGLVPGTLVTDVGSVKGCVHRDTAPLLAAAGVDFLGSHPMAGSERTGMESAEASLFEGAACFITGEKASAPRLAERLECFWRSLGCSAVHRIAAEDHDSLVARISHFPHAIAAAAARVALVNPGDARFAGGGLRDTTRVAAGDPGMWAGIFMENRDALAASLGRCLAEMTEMLAMLQAGDHEAVRGWLAGAKSARDHVRPAIQGDFP